MKILFVGGGNANTLAREFRYYGINAHLLAPSKWLSNPFDFRGFDIVYGVYLMDFSSSFPMVELMRKKYVIHMVGSDAFRYVNAHGMRERARKKLWDLVLDRSEERFFVTEELREIMGYEKGGIFTIPIDTRIFRKHENSGMKRDVLFYCPDPIVYRLDSILDYAKKHPDETVTIVGYSGSVSLPNVEVIKSVSYEEMPLLYSRHRRLIRMTTHDGSPRMPYEALLSGLDVTWNDVKISNVPPETLMENAIPKLISVLREIVDER
jgi:hypothetical protein